MTALMFFRGDRRTAHVEEPSSTNLIWFNDPLPRRAAAQCAFAVADDATRQGARCIVRRTVLARFEDLERGRLLDS